MFKGSLVALITPFRDHELDESAFQEHVAWQINQGTHGLVPCGTTGESPALADEEQKRLVSLCVEVAKGKQVPVIAGTGISTAVIASRFNARESISELAEEYSCNIKEIEEAIRWETGAVAA